MKIGIYSIHDALTGYMTPNFDVNDLSAMRNFELACSSEDSKSVIKFRPQDFDLFKIGEFDSETGVISALTIPKIVMSGNVFHIEDGDKNDEA